MKRNVFRLDLNESREGVCPERVFMNTGRVPHLEMNAGNDNAVLCFAGRALVLATITLFSALLDAL